MVGGHTEKERFIPDLLDLKHEYLFRMVGRDGKYSTELKCLFLVLVLFIPCLVMNVFSGTLSDYFISGWGHFVATVAVGLFFWIIIRFQKRVDERINFISQAISPPKRKREQEGYEAWVRWKTKIGEYANWAKGLFSYREYYLHSIVGLVCGFYLSLKFVEPGYGWVQQNLLKVLYLRAWWVFLGFLAGASLYYVLRGFWAIRVYCKNVVSHEEILPLHPDKTGGLKELGKLSLDLDLIVALPSLGFPLVLLEFMQRMLAGWEIRNIEWAIVIATLYALTLVFFFFISISPTHDAMITARNDYILKVHSEYRGLHEKLLEKLNTSEHIEPEEYSSLSNLHDLYKRVEDMAVWPLDFRTTLRFSLTSIIPLITTLSTLQFV